MTFRLFIVLVLCPIGLLWSGEKKLDLETAVSHYRTLQPATLKQVQWLKAGDLFSCVVEGEPRHFLKIYNTDLAEVAELALDDLNSALALKEKDRLPAFPQLFWHTKQTFYFWNRDTLRLFDLPSGKMEKSFSLPEGAQDPKLAPNLKWVAFRKDNNLWISRKPGEYEPVTREESPEIISGSYVHRREFGISEGIFPSPEGKYLAFYQKDEREVEDYPYVDLTTLPAAAAPAKYPMAGSTNHKVRIGIVRPGKAEITWLKGVEGNTHYFANPTWSPDEKYLWVTRINRDQTTLEMLRFQASSGELEGKVFEESAERYLDPQTGPFFIGKNDDRALWLSQKDGYNHLYLVQTKDKAVSQLTRGEWEISDFLGSSESGEEVYFSAARESPITRDLYRFSPGDGAISRLSEGTGTHRCIISLQNGYFVDLFSSITVPNRVTLMKGDGSAVGTLLE
nr:DPP IV N-terminal domain-containing protein [Calditrichia bacterium]